MSELPRAGCVLTLRLVSLILLSALQCIQRCQVCTKLRLTVKVRWPIIARSIDTHAFLPWRLLSIELVTVWRGFDSLRGFGGQGRAIDDGNTYFSIYFFPPNRSDKEWQLCTTKGPTPVFKRFWGGGGREGHH